MKESIEQGDFIFTNTWLEPKLVLHPLSLALYSL